MILLLATISYIAISYIAVAMYSRDQYEIIGLRKISHFIKQPCRNVCLEKNVINASKLLKQFSMLAKQGGKSNFCNLQQAFKIRSGYFYGSVIQVM